MTIEKNAKSACELALDITAAPGEIKSAYNSAVRAYVQNVSVPGFRKGKVPVERVKKEFAAGIKEETIRRALPDIFKEAVKEAGLAEDRVLGAHEPENVALTPDGGLSLTLTVELKPDFALPKYRGLQMEKKPVTVGDDEVDAQLDAVRKSFAKFEDAKEGDSVDEGDFVEISFAGRIGEESVEAVCPEAKAISQGDGFWTQVAEGRFMPEVLQALHGMKPGETKTGVKVEFKAPAPEALAGKSAEYEVTLKTMRKRILPTDEEFLQGVKAESIDAFRAGIRERLEAQARQIAEADMRDQAVDLLVKDASFDVPPSVLMRNTHEHLDFLAQRAQSSGVTPEYLEEHREEIMASANDTALRNARLSYILSGIAEAEKIAATDEDVLDEIKRAIAGAPKEKRTPEQILADLRASGRIASVVEKLNARKALDFVVANAK